jgi:hypothetical protein
MGQPKMILTPMNAVHVLPSKCINVVFKKSVYTIWLLLLRYIEVVFKMYTIRVVAIIFSFRVKAHRSYFSENKLYMDTRESAILLRTPSLMVDTLPLRRLRVERYCATNTVKKPLPECYVRAPPLCHKILSIHHSPAKIRMYVRGIVRRRKTKHNRQ